MKRIGTTIEQSNQLLELGIDPNSADMVWLYANGEHFEHYCEVYEGGTLEPFDVPAWSLVALLSLLPRPTLHQTNDGKWYCDITDNRTYFSKHYDNPIDACVEMIMKLKELNLLK